MIFSELIYVLDPEPHEAALNMAIDEALLRSADRPLFRIYGWVRPAVSFGYFGKHAEVARSWPGRDLVRRWTGGGEVSHGEDLTYTLIAPPGSALFTAAPLESYRTIHERVAALLAHAGHHAELTSSADATASQACFEKAAMHDVLAGGKKIAGAAQRRTRWGLLHQGSIQPAASGILDRLRAELPVAFSPRIETVQLAPATLREAQILAAEKYGSDDWLRRR